MLDFFFSYISDYHFIKFEILISHPTLVVEINFDSNLWIEKIEIRILTHLFTFGIFHICTTYIISIHNTNNNCTIFLCVVCTLFSVCYDINFTMRNINNLDGTFISLLLYIKIKIKTTICIDTNHINNSWL